MTVDKKKKSLSVGIVVNLIATFILRAIGLITAPITTRLLGTSDYGAMSIFTTWVGISTIVLGIQTYGTFNNARIKYESLSEYYRYCWNALILSGFGHLAWVVLIIPWRNSLSEMIGLTPFLIVLMIAQSFFQNCINMLSGQCMIENKAGLNMMLSGAVSIGSFALSVFLVGQPIFHDCAYLAFIIGHFAPTVIVGTSAIVWFAIKGLSTIKVKYLKYCLTLSIPLVFHGLSGAVLEQSDRIMLERMINLSEAGVYSLTYSFSSVLLVIWGAINSIWVPFYFRYLKDRDYSELRHHVRNFDTLFLVLYLGFLLLSPEVFHIMDNRYWNQMGLIPVLSVGFYFNYLYGYPANYEFYMEKTNYLAAATVGAAILNIILNVLLIPRFHAMGAAIATTVSYILVYLFHCIVARVLVKDYPFGVGMDIIRIMLGVVATLIYYLLQGNVWLRWGLGVIIGAAYLIQVIKKKEIL